jgi:GNAT superfamily N-acetyltransferase
VIAKRLPRYLQVPATLLGRLAVSSACQGQKLGRHLLRDAIHRSWRNTTEVASAGVVVDALDDAARTFYIHHEFIPLLDHRNRLFLAMVTIDRAFKARRRQKRVLESGSHSSKSDKQNKAARAAPERADRWAQNPTSNQI